MEKRTYIYGVKMQRAFLNKTKAKFHIFPDYKKRKATIPLTEVEQFFSWAELFVDAKRQRMNAETLKTILMQNLWQKQENYEVFCNIDEEVHVKASEIEN